MRLQGAVLDEVQALLEARCELTKKINGLADMVRCSPLPASVKPVLGHVHLPVVVRMWLVSVPVLLPVHAPLRYMYLYA
jgi:hypothetical protein